MKILNLTQHKSTTEQVKAGVIDVDEKSQALLKELLTFKEIPDTEEIKERAENIALLAEGHESALIGGAPYLMSALESALKNYGVKPFYAFSIRESVEETKGEQTIKKSIFKHAGFIQA